MFLAQLNEPMIYILFAAAAISLLLKEVSDAIIVLVVVLLNAIVGMVQEAQSRAGSGGSEKAIQPHGAMVQAGRQSVLRCRLRSWWPGDVVVLEAGAPDPGGPAAEHHGQSEDRGIGADRRIGAGGKGRI